MPNDTDNHSQASINWQLISQGIADGVIPAPSGSNENGEPYWLINGNMITWHQVQEYVTKLHAQRLAAGAGSTEQGIEAGPAMPSMPSTPESDPVLETGPELSIEKGVESVDAGVEQGMESRPEEQAVGKAFGQASPTANKPSTSANSFVGQSAPLQTVDPSDPASMLAFSQANKGQPLDSSNRFLAEFLDKILRVLSLEVK